MKKILLSLVAAVLISGGISASVRAIDNPALTAVTGVITDSHVAVPGADVTVLCQGNTKTDTTDAFGSYVVGFLASECPFGSTVKVTAQKGGKSGVASDTVRGITTKLNLAIVNVSIPEYGIIGALTATGAGAGLIMFARRRRQMQLA